MIRQNDKPRVCAIGLDGATFDLVQPWVEQGHLPTLGRLMAEGSWGMLRSVIPPLTMPAWASFLTGQTPGRHGLYGFLRRHPDSYALTPFNASYLRAETIGAWLTRHDKRVALVNIPAMYPPRPINGFMVTGLETPSRQVTFTYPDTLGETLVERFDYEIEQPEKYEPGREASFQAAVNRVEAKRLQAVLWLLEQEDWDLFATVFRGTDVLAHAFWRFMDPTHPAHDPALAERYGDVLRQHYQIMDAALATIEEHLPPNTTLMLMSDHGFGPMHRDVYLDNVLLQHGLIQLKHSPLARLRYGLFRLGVTPHNILNLLQTLRLQNIIRGLLPHKARAAARGGISLQNSVDWSHTKVYPLGGGGQLCINLKGREPAGVVESGREYDQVCDQIETHLLNLRDPDTGLPIVERVWRREEIYGADYVEDMPDLYIEWKNDSYTDIGGVGFSHGLMSPPLRGRSGGHTMRGIFLMRGPGIKQGQIITGTNLYDLAPTIMHHLGLPIPQGLAGQALLDIYDETEQQPVTYDKTEARQPTAETYVFSESEQNIIEKRLHDLGYI